MTEIDYQRLYDQTWVGLLCFDADGKLLTINQLAAELLQQGSEQPVELPDCLTRIKAALQANQPCEYEDEIAAGDQKRWYSCRYQAIHDPRRASACVQVTLINITRQHQFEAALADSEDQLRHSQKVGHLGSWYLDLEQNRVYWSDGLFDIYGLDKESGVPDISLWQHEISPVVDLENRRTQSIEDRISQTLIGAAPYADDFRITRQNTGEVRYIHSSGQIINDEDGKPTRMIGTVQDVTEQKKKEQDIIYISYHDSLTGLYNRRFFEEELQRLNTRRQLPLSIILGDVNGLKLINDVYGHRDGDKLLQAVAELLRKACRSEDLISRWGGDEFIICLPKTDTEAAEMIIKRIIEMRDSGESGFGGQQMLPSISLGLATKFDETEDIQQIIREAENCMYRQKLIESKSLHSTVLHSMQQTLFERGIETPVHADRLAVICQKIGCQLGLPQIQIEELNLLANLHDIGKIIIDLQILNKPAKLSGNEWDEIKRHTETGYRIAKSTPELTRIAESILSHHEQWDGKGYPQGLAGQEIPLSARILSVADSYDTMTHDRPYMNAISLLAAREELMSQAGRQFDPQIVRTLIDILDQENGND